MESSTSKSEIIKPLLLKAGVPLALSVAAFISAKIMARKSFSRNFMSKTAVSYSQVNSHDMFKHEERFHGLASLCVEAKRIDGNAQMGSSDSVMQDRLSFSEEILSLRSGIEGLHMRELELQRKFNRYCDSKEKESALAELKNMMVLEAARVEFFNREVSSIEAENKRFHGLIVQYMQIIEQFQVLKSENRFLQKKVTKLVKKTKAQSLRIKEKNLKITSREDEIARNHETMEMMNDIINKLESEIRELHTSLDKLRGENNELLQRIDFLEKSCHPEEEFKRINEEDYTQLLNELENLQKERADEVKELIYSRWMNACLKHELMRNHEEQEQHEHQQHQENDNLGLDFGRGGEIIPYDSSDYELEDHGHHNPLEHNVPCFGFVHGDHPLSKRSKLIRRLRKWVEGGERNSGKVDDNKTHKYSESQYVSEGTGKRWKASN